MVIDTLMAKFNIDSFYELIILPTYKLVPFDWSPKNKHSAPFSSKRVS